MQPARQRIQVAGVRAHRMRQRRREGGEIADRAAQLTRGPFVECDLDTSGDVGDVAGDLSRNRGEPRDVGKSRTRKDVAAACLALTPK